MNSVNSKTVKSCIKILLAILFSTPAFAWEVDFSRRQVDFNKVENQDRLPASVQVDQPLLLGQKVFEETEPAQDIVILNTEKGFVPETVHLRKNGNYRIHVVNVNPKEKNVSFVLDAFSEHHNTIFGEEKTFSVSPKTDGIFSYQCPETAVQGRFIVFSPSKLEADRQPASN